MLQVSNNTAEYEALIAGLRLAKAVMARRVEASSNSQLVVRQVNGEYETKKVSMPHTCEKSRRWLRRFSTFHYVMYSRSEHLGRLSVEAGHL